MTTHDADSGIPEVLRDRQLIVLDVEGNGQQPPEIIELGALASDLGATSEDLRSWLIRPIRPIATIVTNKVHGITNADVAGSPAWPEVADDIAALLADRTLIAHNASVEHRVLAAHLPDWKPTLVLDTLRLAKHVWPTAPGYSLDGLIRHSGVVVDLPDSRPHRAPYDAWCVWKLLCCLVRDSGLDWSGVVSIAALPGFAPAGQREEGLVTPSEVERPVTVGVMGTHSTGKSMFLARMVHELRRQKIAVGTVADLGEQAQRIGLPILWNHTWASTLWIISRGISDELEAWLHADVVLIDRPVPDALGYYRAALEYRGDVPDPAQVERLETLVADHSGHYDILYRTTLDPTIPLGANKSRDKDPDFRRLADKHIGAVLRDLRVPHHDLPAGGHDEALESALAFVNDRLSGTELAAG